MNPQQSDSDAPTPPDAASESATVGYAPDPQAATDADADASRSLWRRAVLYPDVYVWYVFVAALDIMLTWIILHSDGSEVNLLADWIIRRWDLPGTVIFKFSCALLVVLICEFIGRVRPRLGRRLAQWAIALTAVPVVWAFTQLLIARFG